MLLQEVPPSRLAAILLRFLSALGLTRITVRSQDGSVVDATNLTILNVLLVRLGPLTEKRLTQVLITLQVSYHFRRSNGELRQMLSFPFCRLSSSVFVA